MFQGRLAANLAAEMKEKKDYAEAMFAKYEEGWRDSWIGEDDLHEICVYLRDGSAAGLVWTMDDVVDATFRGKWNDVGYPALILSAMPKLINALPAMQTLGYGLKQVSKVSLKKANDLLGLLGMAAPQ
jgi:flavin-dependent dehydrogenase